MEVVPLRRRLRRRSASPPLNFNAEQAPSQSESKTCLRLPLMFVSAKKSPRRKRGEEQRSLLEVSVTSSGQISSQEDDDDEDTSTETEPLKLVSPASASTPATASATPESLLTMPTPQDRSHKKRLELERSGKQLPTYQGELEPMGFRGQEASITARPQPPQHVRLNLSSGAIQAPMMRQEFQRHSSNSATVAPIRIVAEDSMVRSISPMSRETFYSGGEMPDRTKTRRNPRSQYEGEMVPPSLCSESSPPPSRRGPRQQQEEQQQSSITSVSSSQRSDPIGAKIRLPSVSPSQRIRRRPIEEPPAVSAQSLSIQETTIPLQRGRAPTRIDEIEASRQRLLNQAAYITKDPRKIRLYQSRSPSKDKCLNPLVPSPRDVESTSTKSDDILQSIMPQLLKEVDGSEWEKSDAKSVCTKSSVSTLNLEAMSMSAKHHVETREYELALSLFSQVLSLYIKKYGLIHPLVASTYHNLGMVHSQLAGQLQELQQQQERQHSLEYFQAAARTARDSLGKNHPNVAVSLVRIGFLLLQAQQYKNALVTFTEALRIRVEHFGQQPHGLVANLYNNLGICHLHLKRFAESQKYLDRALEMQRFVLKAERINCSREELRTRLLEVADTLCNLGGLYLEKMSLQPGFPKHGNDAEHAFAEALEIRSTVLGPTHLLVLQIQQLLDRVRSATPAPEISLTGLPISKSSQSMKKFPPIPEIAQFDMKAQTNLSPISSPSPQLIQSARSRSLVAPIPELETCRTTPSNQAINDPNLSEISPLTAPAMSPDVIVPDSQHSPLASRALIFSPCDPPSPRHPFRGYGGNADRSKPRDAPVEARARYISGAVSPPGLVLQTSWESVEENPSRTWGQKVDIISSEGSSKQQNSKRTMGSLTAFLEEAPPLKEIVFDSTANVNDVCQGSHERNRTRIWVSPHCIPAQSPPRKPIQLDDTSLNNGPLEAVDSSGSVTSLVGQELFAEESCLLSESGVISDHAIARIINASSENGVDEMKASFANHEIMVVRPFGPSETVKLTKETLEQPLLAITASWGQSIPPDTSPERVAAATMDYYDSPSLKLKPNEAAYSGAKEALFNENNDGIAKLFVRHQSVKIDPKITLTKSMLDEPEVHLFEIHAIASKYMRKNRLPEALHLFLLILKVQRKINGELHEDVGAAIHNVGLAQLRMDRHKLAHDSFARAVRIRKGALGIDHPDVASSQVKVGISLLLLHEFDQALHAFRDALSTRKRALGALHPSLARVYNNIGCVHVEFNELRDARRAFEAALDIQRNALCHEPTSGPLMFGAATTLCNLGYLYRYREMPEKAALVLYEALCVSLMCLVKRNCVVFLMLSFAISWYRSSTKVCWDSVIRQFCPQLIASLSRCR